MKLRLSAPKTNLLKATVQITGSKSETNRLLLLQSIFPQLAIENLSNSDDARVMANGVKAHTGEVDIHHAGTAMRFLTAFFASQENREVVLTGSFRMKERPIKILVEALKSLGADIEYLENDGYPPLKIRGKRLTANKVSLPANVSSQYISALLLIAPSLENGLELNLEGKITSIPYIKMTLGLLGELGIQSKFEGNTIVVNPLKEVDDKKIVVESDWSAASYYYSVAALADVGTELSLGSYKMNSLQGDSVLTEIYRNFGVETKFETHTIILTKTQDPKIRSISLELSNAPDIAQTIAVTCYGLGMGCHLKGLHTLPIKETDRLAAMKTELEKFGARVEIDHESLTLSPSSAIKEGISVDTYHDHRMAMAFAPLAMKTDLSINDAEVVSKSYLEFWNDFQRLGIAIKKIETN